MGKVEKKRKKMQERIDKLQNDLTTALTKKSGSLAEINVGETQRKILELRKELKNLK